MKTRRKALADGTFYAERFASSPVFEKGILGSDVAPRVALLATAEDVETVLFLQWQSWQPGGLEAFAERLRTRWPERLMPHELRLLTGQPERNVTDAELDRLPLDARPFELLLEQLFPPDEDEAGDYHDEDHAWSRRRKKSRSSVGPRVFTVAYLVGRCARYAEDLAGALKLACCCPEKPTPRGPVEPSTTLADAAPWYFPDVFECVRQMMAEHAQERLAPIACTSVATCLFNAFEDAGELRHMLLALGEHRIGKSTIARAWCNAYPGRARYVEIPEGNDDENFFRAFSKALGLASGASVQNRQMRDNLQRMLHRVPILLVCDNAAFFWPRSNRREALPKRIEWLTSTLVDHGVPVVLLAAPEFADDQRTIVKKTGWDLELFRSRVAETVYLSGKLSKQDVLTIGEHTLKGFSPDALEVIAKLVSTSERGMAVFEPTHRRASLIARRNGRDVVKKQDVLAAISDHIGPTERLLKAGAEGADLATASRAVESEPERQRQTAPRPQREISPAVSTSLKRAGNLVASG